MARGLIPVESSLKALAPARDNVDVERMAAAGARVGARDPTELPFRPFLHRLRRQSRVARRTIEEFRQRRHVDGRWTELPKRAPGVEDLREWEIGRAEFVGIGRRKRDDGTFDGSDRGRRRD